MLGFQINDSAWLTEPVTVIIKLGELGFDEKLSPSVTIWCSNQNEDQKPNPTEI